MRRVMGKGPPLTPVSSHDGKVVAANLLEGNHHQPNNRGVPGVGFTLPPIASVGMGEDEARAAGIKFHVKVEKTENWYSARRVAETVNGYKTLVEEDSGRILGAHSRANQTNDFRLSDRCIRHRLHALSSKGNFTVILESVITCPNCGVSKTETMPTDACLFFYDCTGCGELLQPKPGDCCVFCSYGSVPCPPIQAGATPTCHPG